MAVNLADFKAKWRTLAAERGIDVAEGATSYQVAAAKAEARKRTHHERARQAVYADADKPTSWMRYDNGVGAVDGLKVERQARRDWWVNAEYWRGGGRRITIRHPKWTSMRLRMTDSARHMPIVIVSLDEEELEEVIVSRIPPPDLEAVRNLRREARRLEGQVEERSRAEDKAAIWREAWIEDGDARKRQVVRTDYSDIVRQLQFAFA